jgi:hypothetical protein
VLIWNKACFEYGISPYHISFPEPSILAWDSCSDDTQALEIDHRVMVRFRPEHTRAFLGTVRYLHEDSGRVAVEFDDGDTHLGVERSCVRVSHFEHMGITTHTVRHMIHSSSFVLQAIDHDDPEELAAAFTLGDCFDVINRPLEGIGRSNRRSGTSEGGASALHLATQRGKMRIVRSLLSKWGSEVDLHFHGDQCTPLVIAVTSEDSDLPQECGLILLEYGADPNQMIDGERPVLVAAVMRGMSRLVERLLKCGADPRLYGNDGLCALQMAIRSNSAPMVRMLMQHDDIMDPPLEEMEQIPTGNETALQMTSRNRMVRG